MNNKHNHQFLKLVYSSDKKLFESNKNKCIKCGIVDSMNNRVYDFFEATLSDNYDPLCERCVDVIFESRYTK